MELIRCADWDRASEPQWPPALKYTDWAWLMSAWPAVSYKPEQTSWRKSPFRPPIKTEMDGGNVRLRRQPGDTAVLVAQTIVLTLAEFATLESWVENTIAGGTAQFTMNVLLSGTTYSSQTVQFEPNGSDFPYSVAWYGGLHKAVTMTLRVFV